MSEETRRGIANLATKRRPDAKRMLARNRTVTESPATESASTGDATSTEQAAVPAQVPAEPAVPEPAVRQQPRYLQLVRKEARLREDQLEELSAHARRLQRAKGTAPGPRITDNTLIRVAVDLLANRLADLEGTTEEELLASILPR